MTAVDAATKAARPTAGSQGESWLAIARLPDWYSGTWGTLSDSMEAAVKDCCTGSGEALHMTPKYAAQRGANIAAKQANPDGPALNNAVQCSPIGMPAMMSHPILFQFLFTPGKVTILFIDGEVRRINTAKGAAHPAEDEQEYPPSGDSIGHWEGGTLVVETVGIAPAADLFVSGGMHVTKQTRVDERIHLIAAGKLQIDTVVTDPAIFDQPYRYTRFYQRVSGDFVSGCAQNNRDNESGTLDLTPPS